MPHSMTRCALLVVMAMIAFAGCKKSPSVADPADSDQPKGGSLSAAMREDNRRISYNNLRQIGLAMHNHHDEINYLPSAISDPTGKPLLSWRVAILPYIEQGNLHKEFHLNEPWDSEHNKRLISKMPKIYLLPGAGSPEDGKTYYRELVSFANGPPTHSAAFQLPVPGKAGFPLRASVASISDGMSNTILVVEAAEPVTWTKPDELVYDNDKPVPAMLRDSFGQCHVLMGDGAVRTLRKSTKEATVRALITARANDIPGDDW